jgi:soluble lytic murein transglycosylase
VGNSTKTLLIAIIAGIIILSGVAGFLYYYNEVYLYKTDYMDSVMEAAALNNVDAYLIFSIIKVESAFDAEAESAKGAIGLMQVLPSTAEYIYDIEIDKESLYLPKTNINAGSKYLSYLFTKFESVEWVLAAYNAGETITRAWINQGIAPEDVPYKETREYIKKVFKAQKRYRELYYLY